MRYFKKENEIKITKEDVNRKVYSREGQGEGVIFAYVPQNEFPIKVGFKDGSVGRYYEQTDLISFEPPKKIIRKTFYQGIHRIESNWVSCTDWHDSFKKLKELGHEDEDIISREFEVEVK